MPSFSFEQSQQQIQSLRMSAEMRQSIQLITLSTFDLRDAILKETEENPALEVLRDSAEIKFSENAKKDEWNSQSGADLQAFLENQSDNRETLQSRLLRQLGEIPLENDICDFAAKIIQNLDSRGFNIEPPETLFFGNGNPQKLSSSQKKIMDSALEIVRNLDPIGTAFSSSVESLRFQAEAAGADALVLQILDEIKENSEDFLNSSSRIQLVKKIKQMEKFSQLTNAKIEYALDFIKKLNPIPAAGFGFCENNFAIPEIAVNIRANIEGEKTIEISHLTDFLPKIAISDAFASLENSANGADVIRKNLKDARSFLQMIEGRNQTLLKIATAICSFQAEFFIKGKSALKPCKLADIARECELSVSTVSRMTSGKFLQCDLGVFELKYFFSNKAQKKQSENFSAANAQDANGKSKVAVKQILAEIIAESQKNGKKYSDSKIVKILQTKGIEISRRTVAKYRAEMSLPSSYST